MDRPHINSYQLRRKYGILDQNFSIKNLERVPDIVAKGIDIPIVNTKVTLTMAAEKESTSTRMRVSCQCTGKCDTKRCRCIKKDLKCTVHCHKGDNPCKNLSNLAHRTEIRLKEKASKNKRQWQNNIGDCIVVSCGESS